MSKLTDLDAVQQLCDAATPGPWTLEVEEDQGRGTEFWIRVPGRQAATLFLDATAGLGSEDFEWTDNRRDEVAAHDGALIINARTLVPQMVAEIRELRAELAAERARTDALVAKFPACTTCRAPATRSAPYQGGDWGCDEHAHAGMGSVYYHEPLRAIAHARRLAAGGEESGK